MIDRDRLKLIVMDCFPEEVNIDFDGAVDSAVEKDGKIMVRVPNFMIYIHPITYEVLECVGGGFNP